MEADEGVWKKSDSWEELSRAEALTSSCLIEHETKTKRKTKDRGDTETYVHHCLQQHSDKLHHWIYIQSKLNTLRLKIKAL